MTEIFKRLGAGLVRTPRRLWGVAFIVFFALAGAWSMATPMIASPDEPAHIVRAAAVVRGQFNGPEVFQWQKVHNVETANSETGAQLPQWYAGLRDLNQCYEQLPWRSAACAPPVGNSEKTVQVSTAAGRYNPMYYLAVGWPSLFSSGDSTIYLMRLASAAFNAALLASAVVTAAEWRRRSLVMLGLVTAAVPMTLFLSGVVNPNGVEATSSVLVWVGMLSLLMSPDRALLKRRLLRVAVAGAILVNVRPLGMGWLGVALVTSALVAERGAIRQLLRERAAWLTGGALVVASALGMVWAQTHPDHSYLSVVQHYGPMAAAKVVIDSTPGYTDQMINDFGWLDASGPAVTLWFWIAIAVLLSLLALCFGKLRESVGLLGIYAGIIMIPVAAQVMEINSVGLIWQGRYTLAVAAGLPILAAMTCAKRAPESSLPWRRLAIICGTVLTGINLLAFFWVLRRYVVGSGRSLLTHSAAWNPPGTWMLWFVLYALALGAELVILMVPERKVGDGAHAESEAEPGGRTHARRFLVRN
ncbi:hypothetical protein ABH930_004798 [Kitasatospora sp. GAS204A]|nr:hypothetical protein [Kitasatospora sp. GAS204B]